MVKRVVHYVLATLAALTAWSPLAATAQQGPSPGRVLLVHEPFGSRPDVINGIEASLERSGEIRVVSIDEVQKRLSRQSIDEDNAAFLGKMRQRIASGSELVEQMQYEEALKSLRMAENDLSTRIHGRTAIRFVYEINRLMGISHAALGQQAKAAERLMQAFVLDPNMDMDPVRHSPKIRAMLTQAKNDYQEAPLSALTVTTVPPGARLSINGIFVGETPLTHNCKVGHHFVTISRFGYKDWSNKVTIRAGHPASFNIALEKPPPPPLVARQLADLLQGGQLDPSSVDQLGALADAAEVSWIWVVESGDESLRMRLYSRPHGKFIARLHAGGAGAIDLLANQVIAHHRRPVDQMEALSEEEDAFYQTWWFWTAVGAVVAGGTVTTVLLLAPEGETRYTLRFGR